MSWFNRKPHLKEPEKKYPHHTSHMAEELQREIDSNRRQLTEHRRRLKEEKKWKIS